MKDEYGISMAKNLLFGKLLENHTELTASERELAITLKKDQDIVDSIIWLKRMRASLN